MELINSKITKENSELVRIKNLQSIIVEKCLSNSSMEHLMRKQMMEQYEVLYHLSNAIKEKELQARKIFRLEQFIKKSCSFFDFHLHNFIFISDLHFGGKYEYWPYLYKVMDFAYNRGIKKIFVLGDLIEGSPCCPQNENFFLEQIHKTLRNFPEYQGIEIVVLLGNHDYSALKQGVDIVKLIQSHRKDFIFLNYGLAYGTINQKVFKLSHSIKRNPYALPKLPFDYHLKGHAHFYKKHTNHVFHVPALCDQMPSRNQCEKAHPGFLVFTEEEESFIIDKYDILNRKLVRTQEEKV